MAGLLLSTVGRLWLCGEVWIGPSNCSVSQSLTAWWTYLFFHYHYSHRNLGSYYFVYDTPSFTKSHSSFQTYNGMLHLSLSSLSFCRTLWIILTVIKVSMPLWGHHFSAGRSGNYRLCWQCFSNCTIAGTKAKTKRSRDYTTAWFWRSMHTYIHHYVLPLHFYVLIWLLLAEYNLQVNQRSRQQRSSIVPWIIIIIRGRQTTYSSIMMNHTQ